MYGIFYFTELQTGISELSNRIAQVYEDPDLKQVGIDGVTNVYHKQ